MWFLTCFIPSVLTGLLCLGSSSLHSLVSRPVIIAPSHTSLSVGTQVPHIDRVIDFDSMTQRRNGIEHTYHISPQQVLGSDPRGFSQPPYHTVSRLHYTRFTESEWSRLMPYSVFCQYEDRVSRIVSHYIHDGRRDEKTLIILPRLCLYDDSIRSFLTREERQDVVWISFSKETGRPDCVQMSGVYGDVIRGL